MNKDIAKNFKEHIDLAIACKSIYKDIDELAKTIILTYNNGHKVIVMGNGGSAADAQHFVAELVGKFAYDNRKPLEAIALNCNTSIVTALANDYSGNDIFGRQVIAHAKKGDIVIGLSTSGKSMNVLVGLMCAQKIGAKTCMISGACIERVTVDKHIVLPSDKTPRVQELTTLLLHTVAGIVEEAFA